MIPPAVGRAGSYPCRGPGRRQGGIWDSGLLLARKAPTTVNAIASEALLIHGAWVGPSCWDLIKGRLETMGIACQAPAWPYDDRPVEELRSDPSPELAGVGLTELVDHYSRMAAAYPSPPLLVGHSFGGLVAQLMLGRGVGRAGVVIDSAPTRGVLPAPSAVRANLRVLTTWRSWQKVLTVSFEDFSWAFLHGLPEDQRWAVYEEHVIPTPGRPFWQAAFSQLNRATKVDYSNPHRAPMLFISGLADRTVPASMNRANVERWAKSPAVTELTELGGRTHWIIAEPGWEEVADLIVDFAQRHPAAASQP